MREDNLLCLREKPFVPYALSLSWAPALACELATGGQDTL